MLGITPPRMVRPIRCGPRRTATSIRRPPALPREGSTRCARGSARFAAARRGAKLGAMERTFERKARLGLVAAVLLAAALPFCSGELVLSAACGAGCSPPARRFEIPQGHDASGFRILSLGPGEPCQGPPGRTMAGFSIRRGQDTVLVYYKGPNGAVSDPVPLEDLVLGPGDYSLSAAPARGASVTLSCTLRESKE